MSETKSDASTRLEPTMVRFTASTSPEVSAAVLVGRVGGMVSLMDLALRMMNIRHTSIDSTAAGRSLGIVHTPPFDIPSMSKEEWTRRARERANLTPSHKSGAVPLVRVHQLNYSNPLDGLFGASLTPKEGGAVVAFIDNLMTIGQRRAIMREEARKARLANDLEEVTQDAFIDTRFADSVKKELENESLDLHNKQQRMQMALEMLTAQRKFADDDPTIRPWSLEEALAYLDGKQEIVPQIRDLQSLPLTVELEIEQ